MGKGKVERETPKSTRLRVCERGIYGDELGNDSVVRSPCIEEIGHESLTIKPICRAVNISGLKRFATENLTNTSQLRAVLLSERDRLTPVDFLAKMDVWMRLLNIEKADLMV